MYRGSFATCSFDAGHNIDNICIEALSVELDDKSLRAAERCAKRLGRKVDQLKESDAQRVRQEYDNLVRGLGLNQAAPRTDDTPIVTPAPLWPSYTPAEERSHWTVGTQLLAFDIACTWCEAVITKASN